jgi:hypothetical protein
MYKQDAISNGAGMKKLAIGMVLLGSFAMNALATQQECASFNFPAIPPPPVPVFGQPDQPAEAGNGYHSKMPIPALEMKMFGIELGKGYTVSEINTLLSSLEKDYGIPGSITTALSKDKGHRYTSYSAVGRIGGIDVRGFYDSEKEKVVITHLSRKTYGEQLDWQGLKDAMTSRFGHGVAAAGSNQENFAARFKDGTGGWYKGVAQQCERSDSCEGTVRFKHRNKFVSNNSGGVCVTELYEISLNKIDVLREIKAYEGQAAQRVSRGEGDNLELAKPKM